MDRTDRNFARFVSWVAAHLIAYAAIAVTIRYLSGRVNIIEVALIRSAGSLVISGALLWGRAATHAKSTRPQIAEDVLRSVLHIIGSLALIWSFANLPLAYVATIEFTGPLFAAAAGWLVGRQLPGRTSALGLAVIGLGCAMLLQGQGFAGDIRLLMPVMAVMLLTVTNLMLARLARKRRVASIIFVMHAIQFPAYFALLTWLSPDWASLLLAQSGNWTATEWTGILASGLVLSLAGFLTQAALANASRHGTPLQLCAADIIRLPLIALVGYVVFHERLDASLVVPGLIVLGGSVLAALPARDTRALRA